MAAQPSVVVFDIGNVLVEWNPRLLYAKLLSEREEAADWFLANVCTPAWNLECDRGQEWRRAITELRGTLPEWRHEIDAYDRRWHEMLPGAIEGSVALLRKLKGDGVRLFAITNFSAEKFAECRAKFDFLDLFEAIVVSAHERLVKPDSAIYRILFDRYGLKPGDCVFIDDSAANVAGARQVGMTAIHFRDPPQLAGELRALGFAV